MLYDLAVIVMVILRFLQRDTVDQYFLTMIDSPLGITTIIKTSTMVRPRW